MGIVSCADGSLSLQAVRIMSLEMKSRTGSFGGVSLHIPSEARKSPYARRYVPVDVLTLVKKIDLVVSWVISTGLFVLMIWLCVNLLTHSANHETSQYSVHTLPHREAMLNRHTSEQGFAFCVELAAIRAPVVWLSDRATCLYLERGTTEAQWQQVADAHGKGALYVLSEVR